MSPSTVRRFSTVGVFAALLLAGCSGSPTAPSMTGPNTGGGAGGVSSLGQSVIDGQALSASNQMQANLRVSIDATGQSSMTDSRGRFRLTNVPMGQVPLHFQRAGVDATATVRSVGADQHLQITVQVDGSTAQVTGDNRSQLTKFESYVQSVDPTAQTLLLRNGTTVRVDANTVWDDDEAIQSLAQVGAALQAGQMVEVEGRGQPDAQGVILAMKIEADIEGTEFEGRVVMVDPTTMKLTLDDQTVVVVTATTYFEADEDLTSFAAVAAAFTAGQTVYVEGEGARQTDGSILAGEIEAEIKGTEFDGRVVTAVNNRLTLDDGTVVVVNAATVYDQDEDLTSFTAIAAAVTAGQRVEVEGYGVLQPDNSILAGVIEAEIDGDDFEGRVASVDPANSRFTLKDGTVVAVDANTRWEQDEAITSFTALMTAFNQGQKVRVDGEGTRQADGSILARKIEAEVDDDND